MATSNLGLSKDWIQTSLPVLTALVGVGGISVATMGFSNPGDAPGLFGITVDAPVVASGSGKSTSIKPELSPSQKAYVYIHNIRNISGGLGFLALTAYWQYSDLCQNSQAASEAVRRSLGLLFFAGNVVGFGDAWILSQYASDEKVEGEAAENAKQKSIGHALTQLPFVGLGAWLFFG